jgi:serine-type D-Ala-D-Ala carboxypeptidase (penicillin-binding protein 5/6)
VRVHTIALQRLLGVLRKAATVWGPSLQRLTGALGKRAAAWSGSLQRLTGVLGKRAAAWSGSLQRLTAVSRKPAATLGRTFRNVLTVLVVPAIALPVANYLRPIPPVPVQGSLHAARQVPLTVPIRWPAQGEGALGVTGHGVLVATPGARPLPIASVAKVMTALVALEAMPLHKGESGPVTTITDLDVATYLNDQAQGQSVLAVTAGEQLTEYQALQGLLLPSANNIADLLMRWAFGSRQAGVARMNARAAELHLDQTTFVDASGFDPGTVSTPANLVTLGEAAMRNEVFAEIVSQQQAVLPVAGQVANVNTLLGSGMVGIKTGNTPEAGGCYLFAAADDPGDGHSVLLIGAMVGMPDLGAAMAAAAPVLADARQALQVRHVLRRGQVVGRVAAPWDDRVDVVATRSLDLVLWQGTPIQEATSLRPIVVPLPAGREVGTVTVAVGGETYHVPAMTANALAAPEWRWRVGRRPPYVPARLWPWHE